MTDDELLHRFVAFSAEVTAFSAFDLWGTGQAEAYFSTVVDEVGEGTLRELLAAYRPPEGPSDDPAARASLLDGDIFSSQRLGPLARNIIKLWYAGVWYELPSQWTPDSVAPETRASSSGAPRSSLHEGGAPESAKSPFVVSAAAYTEGLMWRAIGAHPSGAKAQGYGSWAAPPDIEGYPKDGIAAIAPQVPYQARPDQAGA